MATTTPSRLRALDINHIKPHVREANYVLGGELAARAEAYRIHFMKMANGLPTLSKGESLAFDRVINANLGNPQLVGQRPITFFRQVLSLLEHPPLIERSDLLIKELGYQPDAIARAQWLLRECGGVGIYSNSQGVPAIRKSVAEFIEQRDGHPSDPSLIFLTAGASSGVNTLLNIICSEPRTGILVPTPIYPLYSAAISMLNSRCVPYHLDEEKEWMINVSTLKLNLELAKAAGTDVRAIVVINPSNPTGASLSENDVRSVLSFAAEHRLAVIADEVYQNNIYVGHFYSFKRGLRDLQAKDPELYANLEVASLNSVSKGLTGECGHRGGYFELAGFDLDVVAQIFRYASMTMCPPVIGQCLVELVVNPPVEGSPSYSLYKKERDAILDGLKSQSAALFEAFNRMEGVRCEKASGCMFLFPAIEFPPAAIKAAREEAKDPDAFYASRMLDATGVCIVPGSVYDQKSGKWHFRCSFLTPGSEWIDRIVAFHEAFMKEFGGVSLQEDL